MAFGIASTHIYFKGHFLNFNQEQYTLRRHRTRNEKTLWFSWVKTTGYVNTKWD